MEFNAVTATSNIGSIKNILRPNEEIIYSCRPHPKAYFFSHLFKMSPFIIIWLCFDLFAIITVFGTEGITFGSLLIILGFFGVHLTPVWVWLHGFIKDISECKHTEYAITNLRIIIKSGKKIEDIISIDYKKINALNVHINFIDNLLKVGDLYITANDQIAVIYDIKEPKKVMRQIYEIAKEEKIKIQTNSKTTYTSPLQNIK